MKKLIHKISKKIKQNCDQICMDITLKDENQTIFFRDNIELYLGQSLTVEVNEQDTVTITPYDKTGESSEIFLKADKIIKNKN